MKQADYYIEFYEWLDSLIWKYLINQESKYPEIFQLGFCDARVPVCYYLHLTSFFDGWREKYNCLRKEGKSQTEASAFFIRQWEETFDYSYAGQTVFDEDVSSALQPEEVWDDCCGQLLVYLFNSRQLSYLVPVIRQLNRPVVLLSEFEVPENTDLPDSVTALEIVFLKDIRFRNPFLEKHFPVLFHYFNTFYRLLTMLKPQGILTLEGCHCQEQILAVLGHNLHIPTFCIQQGWPSLMHTRFRRMQYDYFLTWGTFFNPLWKTYNPRPQFVATGYFYPAEVSNEKRQITFFLQSPTFICDETYYQELIELLKECSDRFPTYRFGFREHPEYPIPQALKRKLTDNPSIIDVSRHNLQQVFNETAVVVSQFSSALIEGIAYGCIPLVFDPAHGSFYMPDVEKEGWGFIAKNQAEALLKLDHLLSSPLMLNDIRKQLACTKPLLFEATGEKVLKNIANFINRRLE